jgi:ribosomal protein L19E
MTSLAFQRRLAMSIFKCGWRKVWLDPTKQHIIAQAKTRMIISF